MRERLRYLWRARKYRYRHDKQEIGAMLARLSPGDTAVDIGTHKGAYTYWMAKATGAQGKVIAFEPQPVLAAYVRKAIVAAKLDNVTLENLALSDQRGHGTIVLPDDADGGPSPGARLGREGEKGIEVETRTLDEYFAGHSSRPIRFIKCDVEGHELEVFQGGQQVLSLDRPAILFECEERHREGPVHEVFDYLRSLGYGGQFIAPDGLKSIDEFDPTVHQSADSKSDDYINNFLFEFPTS